MQKFQQELFAQLRAEDELVILARGLGLLRLVTNLLHTYDAAGNGFVLVVGATDLENDWIGEGVWVYLYTHPIWYPHRCAARPDADKSHPSAC